MGNGTAYELNKVGIKNKKYQEFYGNKDHRYTYRTQKGTATYSVNGLVGSKYANNGNNGLIVATMDEELMQGANIRISYILTVTNVGETDYEGQDFYYKGTGTSKIVPASLNKSGEVSEGKTSGVNKEEFEILQKYIYKTIKEISKEILTGNISIKPYNKKGKKPCDYCSYKAICGFNPRLKGNCYNYIEKKSKDDIILKMRQ